MPMLQMGGLGLIRGTADGAAVFDRYPLDRFFRLLDNHGHPMIDPSQAQPELTRLVGGTCRRQPGAASGEFVLAPRMSRLLGE